MFGVQDLLDEDGTAWRVTLSMSRSGVAKRMFILEKIGMLPSPWHYAGSDFDLCHVECKSVLHSALLALIAHWCCEPPHYSLQW